MYVTVYVFSNKAFRVCESFAQGPHTLCQPYTRLDLDGILIKGLSLTHCEDPLGRGVARAHWIRVLSLYFLLTVEYGCMTDHNPGINTSALHSLLNVSSLQSQAHT